MHVAIKATVDQCFCQFSTDSTLIDHHYTNDELSKDKLNTITGEDTSQTHRFDDNFIDPDQFSDDFTWNSTENEPQPIKKASVELKNYDECDLPPTVIRAIQRAAAWREGIFATLLTNNHRILLIEIIRCVSWKQPRNDIYISNSTLAVRMDTSVSTVKRGIRTLTEMGWISREQPRSSKNLFVGSVTKLSEPAIEGLGFDLKLPELFFRGSQLTHTIGDLAIQSSTKRQLEQESLPVDNFKKEEVIEENNTILQNNIQDSIVEQTITERINDENPDIQTPVKVEMTYVSMPNGNVISIPKPLDWLLLYIKAPQICRLMKFSRLNGHLLENITDSCKEQIKNARNPMAYITKLIKFPKDWLAISLIAKNAALVNSEKSEAKNNNNYSIKFAEQFILNYAGHYFSNMDQSFIIKVDNLSCFKLWFDKETSQLRQASIAINDIRNLDEAIKMGKISSMNIHRATDAIIQWKDQSKTIRNKSCRK